MIDKYIHIWSIREGKHLKRITHEGEDSRIAWNPKVTADFTFITWDYWGGREVTTWAFHSLHLDLQAVSVI